MKIELATGTADSVQVLRDLQTWPALILMNTWQYGDVLLMMIWWWIDGEDDFESIADGELFLRMTVSLDERNCFMAVPEWCRDDEYALKGI